MIDAFNSTSRYLDDLLNNDNIYFEQMVHRIYPAELQLNKANISNTHYRFEIRQNSVKSTVRREIDHFRCKIGSGW